MTSQQPSVRPWFRLASMAPRSIPAPAPTPTPQPDPVPQTRPTFILPAFRTPAPLSQPQEPTPSPATASLPPAAIAPLPAASPPPPPPPTAAASVPPAFVAPAPRSPPTAVTSALTPAPQSPPTSATAPPRSPPTSVTAARRSPPTSATTPPRSPPTAVTPAPALSASQQSPLTAVAQAPAPTRSPQFAQEPNTTNLKHLSSPSVPQPPKPKVSAPSSPLQKNVAPKPVSPAPSLQQATTATASAFAPRAVTPMTSPKIVNPQPKTPSPSPKLRAISHPPSPLTLPPAQLKSENEREFKIPPEAEQKTVLVQETKVTPKNSDGNNDHVPSYDRKQEASKSVHTKENGNHKNSSVSEFIGMGILTLAGENKGAIMELSPSGGRQSLQKNGNGKILGSGEISRSESNEERRLKKTGAMASPTMKTFMNSNVQGVNNSILCKVSCTHHDPGIHLSVSRKPNNHCRGIHVTERKINDD